MNFETWEAGRTCFPKSWVLVCEDKPDYQARIASAMAEIVDRETTICAYLPDAESAVRAFLTMSPVYGMPAFVLVDHDIPIGPGPLLVRDLRSLDFCGPIIAISAEYRGNIRLLEAGASCCVLKSDTELLKKTCKDIINGMGQDSNIHSRI